MRKIVRYLLWFIAFILLAVVVFALLVIIPIDRTPIVKQELYTRMMSRLDSLQQIEKPKAQTRFQIGFAVENLTPNKPLATAGYGNRRGKPFSSVHDSIYVRAMVIDNGTVRVAIVTADLLIIPPAVTEVLAQQLPEINFNLNTTFLGATHTHNSIGNWGVGATQLLYGNYSDSVVYFIAGKIKSCIKKAEHDLKPATLKSGNIPLKAAVRNRLDSKHGGIDSLIRVVEIHRSDSTKGILLSYTAHATCLYSRDLELSRDYPGALVDNLESEGYHFAMFMAGAVGSHGCNPPRFGWDCLNWMSEKIVTKVEWGRGKFKTIDDTTLLMIRVPLELPEPQVKISKNWRVRPWLFEKAFGAYQPYLTALRIGNVVFLGTPCDYSGELTGPVDAAGAKYGLHPVITSFNGHYIGYITRDDYYDDEHYETRLMNWYGPGNGEYISECLVRLTEAVAD